MGVVRQFQTKDNKQKVENETKFTVSLHHSVYGIVTNQQS